MSGVSWQRALRVAVASAAVGSVISAGTSVAAPCAEQPTNVETLRVDAVPGEAVRGRALVVEVRVVREATSTPVGGADVSLRLRTSHGPLFGGADTDAGGLATIRLGLDTGLRPGRSTLAVEAWSEATPGHWCVPAVNEHGYAETSVEVR